MANQRDMRKGYTHVYTGDGKGKTTAMLGLALRAAGAGLKVYIGQFVKNGEYSEVKALRMFLPCVALEQYGAGWVSAGGADERHKAAARRGLDRAAQAIHSGAYDVVMLDEINVAVQCGLVPAGDVVGLIRHKPPNVELVLTGRGAPPEIIEEADLVSMISAAKHYYGEGVMAREGIEK